MYCRRRAAEGAFGDFVYTEGEYHHDVDDPGCNLREVTKRRTSSKSGKEWLEYSKKYKERGIISGPMHYPTHSTSGPICVMNAHAVNVCCYPFHSRSMADHFKGSPANETAFFKMSNGATMRICECREIGIKGRETFRVYGTKASFENDTWCGDKKTFQELSIDEMRDPLPPEVKEAFSACSDRPDFYGGHGGSHAYLVHEFVDAIARGRTPAINAWEAGRYMAPGVMAHKSALKDGELLDVPDWGDAPSA
jgi:hypothetical protein